MGKTIWQSSIRIKTGKSTKLGMPVCVSEGRFISIGVRGRHSNGSKKAEYSSDVEQIDETG